MCEHGKTCNNNGISIICVNENDEHDENQLIKTPNSLRDAEQEQKLWYMKDQDEEDES